MPKLKRIGQAANFTIIENECLQDPTLDIPERGLLVTMLSLPDDWDFSGIGLAAILPCGKSRVFSSLKKIEKAGYLRRTRICDKNGRFIDWLYEISGKPIFGQKIDASCPVTENRELDKSPLTDFPELDNPDVDNPDVDNPDVDNPDVDNPDVDNQHGNKILINQENKNQKSINPSINPSADEQQLTMDGSMDLSIGEVLREIGYQSSYLHQLSDEELLQDITAEPLCGSVLKQCRIPKAFTDNPKAMETAIRLLSCCDYYRQDDLQLSLSICNTLAAMATTAKATYNGSTVNAARVLDKINEMLQTDGDLAEMLDNFIDVWHKIMRERHGSIKNLSAYMKSCLWTWMNVSKLEFESTLLSIS